MDTHAEAESDGARPRSLPARLGIVLLNLLAPGLGVIRLGRLRAGLWLLLGHTLLYLMICAIAALAPTATFTGLIVVLALAALPWVAIYVAAILLGWRWSRVIESSPWWSRWYAIIGFYLIATIAPILPVQLMHRTLYKPFYIPSEAMMPTLVKWDRILADMSDRTPRRGEVIIFRTRDGYDYIKRVAAIGGDSIEMRNGIPIINGVAADQRPAGTMKMDPNYGPPIARRLSEQLPGEQGRHYILDDQISEFDDMPAVKVPVGRFFVLGDNRDHSADSRVPRDMQGSGIVPLSAVRGRPLFITYGPDWSPSGTRINP